MKPYQNYLIGSGYQAPASSSQFSYSQDPRTREITMLNLPGKLHNKKFNDKVDMLSFFADTNKDVINDPSFTEEERAQEILRRKKIGFRNAYKSGYRFDKNELEKIRNIIGGNSFAFLRQ